MEFADLIELAPRTQLEFTPGEEQALVLKNVHSTPVAWKVKTTAVEAYSVRPSQAVLMPGDSASVQICLKPAVLPPDFSTHKFLVQATACEAGKTAKLQKAEWEKLGEGDIKEAPLRVIEKAAGEGLVPEWRPAVWSIGGEGPAGLGEELSGGRAEQYEYPKLKCYCFHPWLDLEMNEEHAAYDKSVEAHRSMRLAEAHRIAVRLKNEMSFEVEVLAELDSFAIEKAKPAAAKRRKILPAAGASSSSSTAVASSSSPGTAPVARRYVTTLALRRAIAKRITDDAKENGNPNDRALPIGWEQIQLFVKPPAAAVMACRATEKNYDNAIYSCSKAELFSLDINDGAKLFEFEARESEAGEEDLTARSAFENQVKITRAASKSTSKQSNDSRSNCGSAGQDEQKSVLLRGQLYLPLDMLTCCGSGSSATTTDVFPGEEQITFFEKAWEPFENKDEFVKLFAHECAHRFSCKGVERAINFLEKANFLEKFQRFLIEEMRATCLSDFERLARTFGPPRVWDLRKMKNLDELMDDVLTQIQKVVTDFGARATATGSQRWAAVATIWNGVIDHDFLEDHFGDMDVSGWKMRGVQSMRFTFRGWRKFSGTLNNAEGLDGWDVTEVSDLTGTFMQCTSFNSPLGSWQTGKI